MSPAPVVSVVIPTRDRSAMLAEALASVRALEGPDLVIELIVVDNGSSDDSRAIAASFGAIVLEETRRGPSASRNSGWRAASGDFIAFLDDDDVWTRENVRPQLEFLSREPDFAAVAGRVQLASPTLAAIGEPYPARWPTDGDMVLAFFDEHPQVGSLVARMGVRDTVGFFDERLDNAEDWEWCMRLALRHKVGFVLVTSVLFRLRPTGTQDDLQWRRFRTGGSPFWRTVRLAGSRRPSLPHIFRILLRARGSYYSYFVRSAIAHGRAGERQAMRTNLRRAVVASPMHASYHLILGGDMRTGVSLLFKGVPPPDNLRSDG